MTLIFTVFGVAQTKGSTRAFVPKGWHRPIITDSNRNVKQWQQLVAERANVALSECADAELLTDAVRLTVAFYLPRPKSLPKKVRACIKKPDLDKLVRAVKDALTSVVWQDDSQVVELLATKHYAPDDRGARVDIRVEPTAGAGLVDVPAAPTPLLEGLL